MKRAVLQVAKKNVDLEGASSVDMALNSLLTLPKVYAVKKLVPNIPEGYTAGDIQYIHGMGYAPMFLYYEQQERFQNAPEGTLFNPERYIYASQGSYFRMDGTEFFSDVGVSRDAYLVLFLDPLAYPATEPDPTQHGSPRLKIGEDLKSRADYMANIDSKYQTLKVHMKDTFTCNLSAFTAGKTLDTNWVRDDWFSFEHNLGFPPVYAPFGINTVGLSLDLAYNNSIPSTFTVNDVNDLMAEKWAYNFGWEGLYRETLWIYVDITKFYVLYRRQNWNWDATHYFPARTVNVDYTIFDLPINREFDLLNPVS